MFVSGFTIIRNAIQYDYPVTEAIRSVLPLMDEFVVAVGRSEDDTRAMIEGIGSDKIRIIDTVWDDALREGGKVLADETNKALDAVSKEADWAFYIQADECLHEHTHIKVNRAMEEFKDDPEVEGLLFDYVHFYGSYDYVGISPRWYRREVRVVRPHSGTRSYRDAQGFRKDGEKLKVKKCGGVIHHYGWVKHPKHQQMKQQSFNKMWHDDQWMQENVPDVDEFDYSEVDALEEFRGVHPQVMQDRIDKMNWKFSFDPTMNKLSFKHRLKRFVYRVTGWIPGEYKNYRLLK